MTDDPNSERRQRHRRIMALADSLKSTTCPSCNKHKPPKKSLCFICYGSLKRATQQRLHRCFGNGYEEAMAEAAEALGFDLADIETDWGMKQMRDAGRQWLAPKETDR